jgi:thiamine pyrophosphokinase
MSPKNPAVHFQLIAQKSKAQVQNLEHAATIARSYTEELGQELDVV